MASADYYEALGVKRGASADEIKAAYRKLAMQHHPDRNKEPGAEARFKEISEAYAVLSDDAKRRKYDQYGKDAFSQAYSQEDIFRDARSSGAFRDFSGEGFSGFEDLFASFFGGMGAGGGSRGRSRGSDLQAQARVTLEEAFAGVSRDLRLRRTVRCQKCKGSLSEPGYGARQCPDCRGTGSVRRMVRMGPFQSISMAPCGRCAGMGVMVEKPCSACRGSGTQESDQTITVKIPPGAFDGLALRLRGEGEAGERGAEPGDLYVVVSVMPHKVFSIDGTNLLLEKKLAFPTLALGGKISVATIDGGTAEVAIPAGTQTGARFRLKGMGMPQPGGGRRGDEIVKAVAETPSPLSPRERELYSELAGGLRAEEPAGEAKRKGRGKKRKGFLDGLFG
jgi:molecular chaperone DnaJ